MTMDERMDLEHRAEAYLDGFLSPDDAAAFEEALLTEEGSEALSQALMFRYLMQQLPPTDAEDELIERIHAALMDELQQADESEYPGIMDRIRGSMQLMGYAFHGPRAAWQSASHTTQGLKAAGRGAETIRYSLGSLRPSDKSRKPEPPRSRLWRALRAPFKLL